MKCNRLVVYGWKQIRNIGKSKSHILGSCDTLDRVKEYKKQIGDLFDRYMPCEGEIKAQIELEDIPYHGGVNYGIEIRFVCNRCGYNHAGENGLPSDIDMVNSFLTEYIKERKK